MNIHDFHVLHLAKRTVWNGEKDLLFHASVSVWDALWRSFTIPAWSSCCSLLHSYSFPRLIPGVHKKLFTHLEVQVLVWILYCLSTLESTVRLRISIEPGFCVRLEGKMGVRCLASEEDHLGEVDSRGEEDHTKKRKKERKKSAVCNSPSSSHNKEQ